MTSLLRAVVALAFVGVAPWASGTPAAEELDAQKCNTGCQETFTDCMDRCDGAPTCQAGCKSKVAECVKQCTAPAPEPSAAPPLPSASAPVAPGAKAPPKGAPPKPTPPAAKAK